MAGDQSLSSELKSLEEHLLWELGRIVACLDDLPEELLHTRPRAAEANSLLGIASHALGAAEEHVFAWILGRSTRPDVDAFDETPSVTQIRERHAQLTERLKEAFTDLGRRDLEELRPAARGPEPIRAILVWATVHAAEHAGAAELTRDLLSKERGGL